MALSDNSALAFEQGERNEFGLKAAAKAWEGSAIGIDAASGYARPLVAGDVFVGFAEAPSDNTLGSNGTKSVRVRDQGKVLLTVAGAAITDLGKAVYASDDGTFTYTATSNSYIGRVVRFDASGQVLVCFEKDDGGVLTSLTAATGTPSDTVADVGGAFNQATLNNNFASLAAKLNLVLQFLK